MATTQDNKNKRTARWERKVKHNAQDKRIRNVLKDRKRQRKAERGAQNILRHAPTKRTGREYTHAVEQLWEAARRLKLAKSDHLNRPGYVSRDNAYLYALAQVAEHSASWLRDPVYFQPRSYNTERQFTELIRYLLVEFPPPALMEQAWFVRDRRKARRYQNWYIQLGRGESPRRLAGMPFEMTRRAAHLLFQAPGTLTIKQGLRWTQMRAMGAAPAMTEALVASPIGTDFTRDDFWLTVVRFLIDQPMLDPNRVGPIVDYIHFQRHTQQVGIDGDAAPLQPGFSMKGRSIERLLRQVEQWHGRLAARQSAAAFIRWEPSGILGMQWEEGTGQARKHYVIRELIDSNALLNEGAAMGHCVGSYAHSCKAGHAAIYRLACMTGASVKSLLTIEVKPHSRTIVQARGKHNKAATQEQTRMLRAWAQKAGLQLAEWL